MNITEYKIYIIGEFSPYFEYGVTKEEAVKTLLAKLWLRYKKDFKVNYEKQIENAN